MCNARPPGRAQPIAPDAAPPLLMFLLHSRSKSFEELTSVLMQLVTGSLRISPPLVPSAPPPSLLGRMPEFWMRGCRRPPPPGPPSIGRSSGANSITPPPPYASAAESRPVSPDSGPSHSAMAAPDSRGETESAGKAGFGDALTAVRTHGPPSQRQQQQQQQHDRPWSPTKNPHKSGPAVLDQLSHALRS